MRVFLPLILLSTALANSTGAQTAIGPTAPAAPAADSTGSLTTYHSDALHLTYQYPTSYKDASSTIATALQASMSQSDPLGKGTTQCISVPFSAMDSSGGGFSLVLFAVDDHTCLKRDLKPEDLAAMTDQETKAMASSGVHPDFQKAVSFTVQGHPAELARGTFQLPAMPMIHTMVVCVLVKQDAGCWQFLASSDDKLRTMGAFPVSVEGAAPRPLVPPDVLAKP